MEIAAVLRFTLGVEPARIRGLTVANIMSRALIVIDHQGSIREALALLRGGDIRHLPVLAEGRLIGMLSDRDLLSYQPPPGLDAAALAAIIALQAGPVAAVMRPNVVAVGPDEGVARVIDLFLDLRIGAAPVVDGDRLVGIVSVIDVLEIVRQARED